MTVGITLTNGLEAVVITDRRSTGSNGRQSDSSTKSEMFRGPNYNGVMFGAGVGNVILGLLSSIGGLPPSGNIDEFSEQIRRFYKGKIDENDAQSIEVAKGKIQKKAALIDDAAQREQFVQQELFRHMQQYDQSKQDPKMQSEFILAAFDGIGKRVRQFYLSKDMLTELFTPHAEIGSGADGAGMYFTTKMQGIDPSRMDLDQMALLAMNAYCSATVNTGVGGTPQIHLIDQEGTETLIRERSVALANVSGAYLAELIKPEPDIALAYFRDILEHKEPRYDIIARKLGINPGALTSIWIPPSSWQEAANAARFPAANGGREK